MKREYRKHQEELSALNHKHEEDKEGWDAYETKYRQRIHALSNNLTNSRKKFHGRNRLLLENYDGYDHANRVQIKTYLKFTFLPHHKFPHKSWSYYKPTKSWSFCHKLSKVVNFPDEEEGSQCAFWEDSLVPHCSKFIIDWRSNFGMALRAVYLSK